MAEPELGSLGQVRALHDQLKLFEYGLKIVRMNKVERNLTVQFMLLVAEQPFERWTFETDGAVRIKHGDDVGRLFDQGPEMRFTLP